MFARFLFNGKDSAGNDQTYNAMSAIITDPTSTSEDSRLVWFSSIAGTLTAVLGMHDGIAVGPDGTTFKGAGTVNALAGLYVNGHGTVAQVVSDTDATYTTLGTILPVDNSIPQNTEGDEVLSVAITPTNASSILRIRATLNVGGNTGADIAMALFVGGTANALAATSTFVQNTSSMTTMHLEHEVSAASTAARTYSIRAGAGAATDAFMNGNNTTRLFGGVAVSNLVVEEILPQ